MEAFAFDDLGIVMSRISEMNGRWSREQGYDYLFLRLLYSIRLNPGATQSQLGAFCAMPKQTVNNFIRRLEGQGYLTLESDPSDRRNKHVVLTPAGDAYVEKMVTPVIERGKEITKKMGHEAYQSLLAGLEAYAAILEKY